MDIEEMRAKCILLGCTWGHHEGHARPWYAAGNLPAKNGWHGRKTELELLEDLLKHAGAYNEHTVRAF